MQPIALYVKLPSLNMRKLLLSTILFLFSGLYITTVAQEDIFNQSQQKSSESVMSSESFGLEGMVAYQQTESQQTGQKDPETPPDGPEQGNSDDDAEKEESTEEVIMMNPFQVTPDSEESLLFPQPLVVPAEAEPKEEEVEDKDGVMGFNFLYFLIQKFKISDIIE